MASMRRRVPLRTAIPARRHGPAAAVALLLTAILLATSPAPARATVLLSSAEQGSWTAADKELHFASCLAIATSLRVTGTTDAQAFTGAVTVGVLQEVYDATLKPAPAKRGASWKDLVADIAGAAAGVLLLRAMD